MSAPMTHLAFRKRMALEYRADRLQVKFGRHVRDRAVFIVKRLGRIRAFAVAIDQVPEHFPMAGQMAAKVHGHEAGQLENARIDRSEEQTSELQSLKRIYYE